MSFTSFTHKYGAPEPGTAVDAAELGLAGSENLRRFATDVGGGVFHGGFISVLSIREAIEDLGPWQRWLPAGSRLFSSSAFGFLLTTDGAGVWTVDTQYGQIVESDYTIGEALELLASPEARGEVLRATLFDQWLKLGGDLAPSEVLCPTPALPLGGGWSVETMSKWTLPAYLSFTGQLFGSGGDEVEVHRS